MVDFQGAEAYTMQDLLELMVRLRAPDGCPWDRVQTHQSIRANMLEEAYEAADAIDRMDMDNLKEELGDVLLQVVFHARIAEEAGRFTFDGVVRSICEKLIFRHPHVFGTAAAADPEGALSAWDAQKREEKGQRTAGDALDGVARALPALTRAAKLQSKAAKAGFGGREAAPALDKLSGALEAFQLAVEAGSSAEEELGELLFAAAEAGRRVHVDGEAALQRTCETFIRRFRRMEALAERPLDQLDEPALEALWRQAKAERPDCGGTPELERL